MNKITKGLIILVVFSTCSSCLVLNDSQTPIQKLNQENFQNINGTYVAPIDTFVDWTLPDLLILEYQSKYGKFGYEDFVTCKLQMIDECNLEIIVFKNGEIETGFKVKGELKDGYFYFKPQKYVESYFGILLRIPEKKLTRIGLTLDNKMIVDSEIRVTSSMFLIRGRHYYDEYYGYKFDKEAK